MALGRWPTTIGGWKTIEKSDGSMALKYKESVTGDAIWPEILATPTWHPATGIPTRRLLIKRGDVWEPKTEIIGPGYRAAYGLVALVHHQSESVNERGEPQLMDHRIRTHGTAALIEDAQSLTERRGAEPPRVFRRAVECVAGLVVFPLPRAGPRCCLFE